MATTTTTKPFLLFAIVVFFCAFGGQGWALRIQISPNPSSPITTTAVNITCDLDDSFNDPEVNEIMALEVRKKGGKPFAVFKGCSTTPYETGNNDTTTTEYRVKGEVNKVVKDSYLTLTLLNPKKEDAGLYQCVMYFLDDEGAVHGQFADASLTFDSLDIQTVVDYFKEKTSELEVKLAEQTKLNTDLKATVDGLENELKSNVSDLEEVLREKVLSGLVNLEATCNELSQKEAGLYRNVSALQIKLQHEVDKENYVSAFSARYTKRGSENVGDVIVYNDVIVKQGQGYDEKTGAFTAPRAGLYAFHLVSRTSSSNTHMDLALRVNGKQIAALGHGGRLYFDQSSVSLLVKLESRDVVNVAVMGKIGAVTLETSLWTVFTGYLFHQ